MGSSIDFGKRPEITEEKEQYNMWDKSRILSYASSLTLPHKLLFLCYSGSKLHGTDGKTSDIDVRGIFLPTEESALCGNIVDDLKYTSNDKDKNSKDDIDINLWSIQKWFRLLEKGDSNALSILFSSLNADMILYVNNEIIPVMTNGYYLFNPKNIKSYTGFSKSQVIKYSQKGNRLQLLEQILEYISTLTLGDEYLKLGDLDLEELIYSLNNDDIFIDSDDKGNMYLNILNKKYQITIPLSEFIDRMERNIQRYGLRAKENRNDVDWKALSHSLRTLVEALELLSKGYVTYPLESANILKQIKYGGISMEEFTSYYTQTEIILKRLEKESNIPNQFNKGKRTELLMTLYGRNT